MTVHDPLNIRIATRASKLAQAQAHLVGKKITDLVPGSSYCLVTKTTQGDIKLATPLFHMGGKGLFVKEVEHALLAGDADLAVHSLKDMPVQQPPELPIWAYLTRPYPQDAWLSKHPWSTFPAGGVVGTSSPRRHCQIKNICPQAQVKPIRGNIHSRIEKLTNGNYDAIILAHAGLMRMPEFRHDGFAKTLLPIELMLPASGQGILAIQLAPHFDALNHIQNQLNDHISQNCAKLERTLVAMLEAQCQSPLAVYATQDKAIFTLKACIGSPAGHPIYRAVAQGIDKMAVAADVYQQLIDQDALKWLNLSWPEV